VTDTRAVHTRTRGPHLRRPAPPLTETIRSEVLIPPVEDAPTSELDLAADLLANAHDVVLVAHIHPDADALGSAIALAMGLSRRGKSVAVSFAEPDSIPESLRALPGVHLVVAPDDLPTAPDLLVSLDVGSVERLGSLARLFASCRQSLVIDHHASNTRFGQFNYIDAGAEATVVMVARILDRLGLPIDQEIAENLYAGLATDTGHFRHADSDAHLLAARLIDAGVRPPDVMAPITDLHPYQWLSMLSDVLGRAVLDRAAAHGRGLVYTVIDDIVRAGLRPEELDSVIDIMRTAQEADVAAVLKQTGPDSWQVSLRSRGPINVAAAAAALGGGGHVRAAGFTHHGAPLLAVDALRAVLDR